MPWYDFNYLLEWIQSIGRQIPIREFMENLRALYLQQMTQEEFIKIYDQKMALFSNPLIGEKKSPFNGDTQN